MSATAWALLSLLLVAVTVIAGLARACRTASDNIGVAWDNGLAHGVRLAHERLTGYRKPWITLGEERGWDMAREQLGGAVAELLEELS